MKCGALGAASPAVHSLSASPCSKPQLSHVQLRALSTPYAAREKDPDCLSDRMTHAMSTFRLVRSPLAAHRAHRMLHLFRLYIPDMGGDRPAMAKRVLKFSVTIAQEHVCDRRRDLGPCRDDWRSEHIDVLDIEVDRDRRTL